MNFANVISYLDERHHQYAVSQLYIAINQDDIRTKLDLLRDGTETVNDWFLSNTLSLNPDKSEVLLLGSNAKLWTIGAVGQVSVTGALTNLTDLIKNLCVSLFSELTFDKHVGKVCQSSYFYIMELRRIWGSLSPIPSHALSWEQD